MSTQTKKTLSAEHRAKLAAAAAARRADGLAPRAIGALKTLQALRWIYAWHWSSPKLVSRVSGDNRNGIAARLERQGLVRRIRTDSGGAEKDVPSYILTLTELGVAKVEATADEHLLLIPYEADPYKINQVMLRHDHLAQTYTLNALQGGAIKGYRTPRQIAAKSLPGVKQFDAIYILPDGERMGIEVELSAKWDRRLDQFVLECLTALRDSPNNPRQAECIAIVSDNQHALKRYKEAFTPGARLSIWAKDPTRHWKIDREIKVPEWVDGKIFFRSA